jgi:FMN phosphatase YigB (HAD superfamily)
MRRLSRKLRLTLCEASTALTKRADGVDLISIDMFDTLRLRLVPPSAVERRAAEHLVAALSSKGYQPAWTADEVAAHRDRFRKRRERRRRWVEVEWLLTDWLAELAEDYGLDRAILRESGLSAELEAELELTTLAPDAPLLVKTARSMASTLVLTSDTSHQSDVLDALLGELAGSFDELNSSGELGLSKRRGGIFPYLEARHSVAPRRCVHIGDHWKPDLLRPMQARWKAIWIRRRDRRLSLAGGRTLRAPGAIQDRLKLMENALAAPPVPPTYPPLARLAYDTLAPLLCLLSLFRWRHFQRQRVDTVLFVARDAGVFLQAARLLRTALPESQVWRYVRLSRHALSLAHPADLLQSFRGLPGKIGKATVGEFLRQFALPQPLASQLLSRANLASTTPWSETSRAALAAQMKEDAEEIAAHQKAQRRMARLYLEQQVGGRLNGVVGIVDVGWSGTHQDALAAILHDAEAIVGCYLGVSAEGDAPTSKSLKVGLIRDDYRGHRFANAVDRMAGSVRLWEVVFQEPIGTVDRLEEGNDGMVEPILGDYRPSPATLAASEQIASGIASGVQARHDGVAALAAIAADWPDEALQTAASALSRRLSARPTRAWANALLAVDYDEGLAKGTIGLAGLRTNVAWYPGLLARHHLRPVQPLLEMAAEVAIALGIR